MSWWGNDPFTASVEKATSELLPSGEEDISLNLDIADQIKSKNVSAKHAMQVLKRRISHKNPNVVLLALGLTDISVKNGGDEFLTEVGSREFVDNLLSILQVPQQTGGKVNPDVRQRILALIQSWSQISDVRPGHMTYAAEVYRQLKQNGYGFPPKDPVESVVSSSAAAFETRTMPDWVDGEVCLRCRTPFTTFTRKHHCRNCGNVFCHQCTSHSMALPWFGVGQPVRVCDGCFARKSIPPKVTTLVRRASADNATAWGPYGRGGAASAAASAAAATAANATSSPRHHTRSKTMGPRLAAAQQRKEEEDLQLAIKLSLQSSGGGGETAAGLTSQPSAPSAPSMPMPGRQQEGTDEAPAQAPDDLDAEAENDPDLAAAIKASLLTAPPQALAATNRPGTTTTTNTNTNTTNTVQSNTAAEYLAPSAPELTPSYSASAPAPAPPSAEATTTPKTAAAAASAASAPALPSVELDVNDVDSLLTFSQAVSRLDQSIATGQAPAQMARAPPPVQAALEKSLGARPRLVRNLHEAESRMSRLASMQAKLDYSVKLYDRLLDAQVASSAIPPQGLAQIHPAPTTMPGYPAQPQPQPQPQSLPLQGAGYGLPPGHQMYSPYYAHFQPQPQPQTQQGYPSSSYYPAPAPALAQTQQGLRYQQKNLTTPSGPATYASPASPEPHSSPVDQHQRESISTGPGFIAPQTPTVQAADVPTADGKKQHSAAQGFGSGPVPGQDPFPAGYAYHPTLSPYHHPSAPVASPSALAPAVAAATATGMEPQAAGPGPGPSPKVERAGSLSLNPTAEVGAGGATSSIANAQGRPDQALANHAPSSPSPLPQTQTQQQQQQQQQQQRTLNHASFAPPSTLHEAQAQAPQLHLPSAPSVPPATQSWLAGPQSQVPQQVPHQQAPWEAQLAAPQKEVSLIEF